TVCGVRAGLAREGFPGTALIGFAGAPFTVACYMVDGHGGGEFPATRRMAHAEPELFAALIETLTEATIAYLLAQAEAGAEALMLFDSWAGLLPPPLFARHVAAPTRRIAAALAARCPGLPVIGFPRLAGASLEGYAVGSDLAGIGVDTGTDLRFARGAVGLRIALQGNLDPLALLAGGAGLEHAVDAVLEAGRGGPFIFNLGHGILPATPVGHVAALVDRVRAA
ncbi:MAG: uroporphyrinogen decarboxylase, partial [Rhodospirillales bacterium]|nr:uroporphyrinogen decarboxylase [Rhodospirillales bacterium]